MKKFIILFALLGFNVFAEIPNQGIATYKQTINIHASLPESQAAMKAFIPEFNYMEITVSYKDHNLRFDNKPLIDEKTKNTSNIMSVDTQNMLFNSQDMIYTQYGNIVDVDYVFTKNYAQDDRIKLTDEHKKVNGYDCKKAIDTKNKLVIWYQEDKNQRVIPTEIMAKVPGLVVKVEGKKISYDLLSIKAAKISDSIFDVPKNSKKISEEQYQDLQEEAMEEMMSSMGGNVKMIKTEGQ